ncbi:hypothetical protein CEUSTIGMA_g5346.t1 [Chlamydomonas eustigma]|uniref:Uncharacterized protein n=1 Tax=Chlamydomonas eustigma TaxID=1157962 RepID=A0A250X493_9CHLO|nr:hypothetical protein CEUSTIGMA_g5346.t1 [Chlamydomonas eustigma]|eukprot:GAX77904.1 hypothetical protein CEUSTIGMA_g5346.t1 [Chlamydomonas eustigma]
MKPISLAFGSGGSPLESFRKFRQSNRASRLKTHSIATSTNGSYIQRVKGFNGLSKAALTSGTLSALGDTLAQVLIMRMDESTSSSGKTYNPWRTLRMFGFGLCWYGPYQYYWYNLLDWVFPTKTLANFLSKVASNQLLLAPCTLTAVFAWNLPLADKALDLPTKLQNDMFPTLQNGWKFWIPAASMNFCLVPVQYQVLYMSCCGILWTAYLSYASTTPQANKS